MNGAAFYLIVMGDLGASLLWIANNYFPMGSFWIMMGLAVYVTLQAKFANQQFSLWGLMVYAIAVLPWMQLNGISILPDVSKYLYYLVALFIIAGAYSILVKE